MGENPTGYIVVNGRVNHNGKKVATAMMDGDEIVVFKSSEDAETAAEANHFFRTFGYQIIGV